MSLKIAGQPIGTRAPVFVIAEIGLNHSGSLARALELVDAAAYARASAIKLQTLYAEEYASDGKPGTAAFRAALTRLNVPASSCIAVGDDPVCDVRGGRTAGLATVRISRTDIEGPVQHEADVVIDRFEELPEVAQALLELVDSHVA